MTIRKYLSGAMMALLAGGLLFSAADAQDTKAEKKAKKGGGKGDSKTPLTPKTDTAMIAVVPHPAGAVQTATKIDSAIDDKLRLKNLVPSPTCTDADFIRRASLDIAGVVPTAERAKAFADSKDPNKRALLVDELLADSRFGTRQSDLWQALLYPHDSDVKFVTKEPLVEWLKESFNANKPWNKTVYELVTASGNPEEHKEATYYMANRTVDKLADSVSRVFMGLQLQCAQCHNHPFSEWTQKEYWGLAQFFMKVQTGNPRAAMLGGEVATVQEVAAVRRNDKLNPLPESAKMVPAKLPGDRELAIATNDPARPHLAKWLTGPDNPYFAKAFVNRLWLEFFGRGLVNPVDNLDEQDKSTHPDLLNALAKEFVASGFDVKYLVKSLCLTQAYQRSSKPTAGNDKDREYYSHMAMKVMSPEQLFDSLVLILDFKAGGKGAGKGATPMKGGPKNLRDQYVAFFTGSDTAKPVDYEAGIPQALRLMNNNALNPKAVSDKLARAGSTPDSAIEQLYLTAYARRPTTDESRKMKEFVGKQATKAEGYGDLLWVLLNSSEFTFIR